MTEMFPHGVRLTIAYDGTEFCGWQHQPGQRTVQGVLDHALRLMSPCSETRGASRTDSGVHAEGQVVSFAAAREIPPHGWARGLNGILPPDLVVKSAVVCAPTYDPRDDSSGKLYRYYLCFSEVRDPLLRHRSWHIAPAIAWNGRGGIADWLDIDNMQACARVFEGTHDFQAFQASNDHRTNTVRTLRRVEVMPRFGPEHVCAIEVEGTAFLKNMVRILAGTLVEAGRRRLDVDGTRALVGAGASRRHAGPTAPAHGLVLEQVFLGRAERS